MASTLDTLEQQVQGSRRALQRDLDEIRWRAEDVLAWEAHYRRHMGVALSAAAFGGLLLGALSSRPARTAVKAGPVGRFATQAADALLAVASTAAADFIDGIVPGFRTEFRTKAPS